MDIKGIALAKQMDDRRNVLRYPNGPLSPAAPIVPTYTGFEDATPTNLENATNGNIDDAIGPGTKILSGSGTVGQYIFDLGSEKDVLIEGSINLGATGGVTSTAYIEIARADGVYLTPSIYNATTAGTYPTKRQLSPFGGVCRYIRIRFAESAATTGQGSIIELRAHEIGKIV